MRGRILRIRPGHLANFSGGAGYMPFIVIFSVPTAFLLTLFTSLTLFLLTRRRRPPSNPLPNTPPDNSTVLPYAPPHNTPPLDLHELVQRVIFVLVFSGSAAVLAAAFFVPQAIGNIYGSDPKYRVAAWLLAAGPLAASFLATGVQAFLSFRFGGRAYHIPLSLALFFLLLLILAVIAGPFT
jgi:hypothetical protein